MAYTVKEIFYTLQGEGANAGRPAVFCRFSGCNLWTGREADRHDAVCQFCDTDFVGVGPRRRPLRRRRVARRRGARPLARARDGRAHGGRRSSCAPAASRCSSSTRTPSTRCTRAASRSPSRRTARGSRPAGVDWLCVSPKADAPLALTRGHELKLVYPQQHPAAQPERFAHLAFDDFFLQPLDAGDAEATKRNVQAALAYCLAHPRWRLSLQTHKLLDIR